MSLLTRGFQFDIFEQHFASDLSFLHAPTFKETLKRGNFREVMNDAQLSRIYAFIALTAPFHPSFARPSVTDERNRSKEAVDNAKRYAKAAHAQVTEVRQPTLETIQALLMLAFHEWSNLQGARSFRTLSSAITDAQALGCHYQDDLLDQRHTVCAPPDDRKRPLSGIEKHIEEETKRRIFWSCYIMDSYFCSTRRRPAKIKREDIQIQLPCSERAFKHGKNIRTRTLYETDAEFDQRRARVMRNYAGSGVDIKWEDEDQQETLCWYIRSLGIWRQITFWACEVARLNETHPPWDKSSKFYGLRTQLEAFIDKLPEEIRLLPAQTRTHIEDRTSRSYTLLHSVLAICDISLHREYLPFAPFGVDRPNGPIDPPLVKGDPDPPDYWDKSAQRCFKAARDIIELMWACNESKVLVHTPLTGFAIYSSLFTVVWVKFFPKFDTAEHLCSPKDMMVSGSSNTKHTLLAQNSNRATTMLNAVQMRVKMVTPWINTIHRLHNFFVDAKAKYRQQRQQASNSSPASNSSSSPEIPLPDLAIYQKFFEMDHKQITEHGRSYEGDEDLNTEKLDIHQGLEEASATCSPAPQKSEDDDNTIDGSPERTVHQQQVIAVATFTSINDNAQRPPPHPETPKADLNGTPTVYPSYQTPGPQYPMPMPYVGPGMPGHMPLQYPDQYATMPVQQPVIATNYGYVDPNTFGFNEGHQHNAFSMGNEQNTSGQMPVYQNSAPYQDWTYMYPPQQPSG
ncbi:hypothetical protein DM02DRAFT_625544 [Periconia macrospinosa]|uniref:Xylanolytic transcriptional activator regulatory domain-containing protein n=1 Tax=Periconia macrospinosa TaxID=97972 RepID=A0A2V1E3R2_9PLEO|nr:hypothetical protein DM02DRAFT_625544 [Periconia macrospinosa]